MLNNPKTRRMLTILMPILSFIVAAAIVSHQYWRKADLQRQIAIEERESKELLSKMLKQPKQGVAAKDNAQTHTHTD